MWSEIKNLIRSITKSWDSYDEKYIKVKFISNDNLSLTISMQTHIITVFIRVEFHENSKNYWQIFLDQWLYELYIIKDCYDYGKTVILSKETNQKCDIFPTIRNL